MHATKPGEGREKPTVIALAKATVRKGGRSVQHAVTYAMRRLTPACERVLPPLGRRLRNWGWIWQPTYSHHWLNEFYTNTVDPYHFDGTSYEAGKYEHTMRLLAGRRFANALEIGAAEGVFTKILAPLCTSLLALEVADAAVARARERLAGCDNVTIVQAALPNQMPDGRYDLIVASDVLYYFPQDVVLELLARFEERLLPGGVLFVLDYLGDFRQSMLGRDVHVLLKKHTTLEQTHDETVAGVGPGGEGYAVTIFMKPAVEA